ncbi:MAG: hypothetical protein NTZ38_02690, partial [Candidatus Taylorbacteria bacterium]|nr:hypothetical protein [Candidatus Taylorbacteria bacterium]
MKIATFNVEFLFGEGEHKHSGKTWFYSPDYVEARVNHLAKVISDIDADFLFLQEVASADTLERIIAKTGKNYSYFLATPDNRSVGNAVIYKPTDSKVESIPAVTDFPVMVEGDTDSIGPKLHSRRAFVHLSTTYNGKQYKIMTVNDGHFNNNMFADYNATDLTICGNTSTRDMMNYGYYKRVKINELSESAVYDTDIVV